MKEATGELNMTVIVVLILAALGVVAVTIIIPAVSTGIRSSSCETIMNDSGAKALKDSATDTYWCCPSGSTAINPGTCQAMEE